MAAHSDTPLHELCKGFGALLSRIKANNFSEEAATLNERGNLPLHTACSHQATAEVVESLLKACPSAAAQSNANGNLPLHQAAMWQAPFESVETLLSRHPEAATVRNQYGSLPLHMAASNQAGQEVVRLLIDAFPEALHLQNDDGMTPLDLALADESASDSVLAMLQGRPPPPELTKRQQVDRMEERAVNLQKKLTNLRDSSGQQSRDMAHALLAVRRLADRFPHSLYAAGVDPNELEIRLSDHMEQSDDPEGADHVILEAVQTRVLPSNNNDNGQRKSSVDGNVDTMDMEMNNGGSQIISSSNNNGQNPLGPIDRVEDLLSCIVGLGHIKSQVRGLRRTTEICDLRESHLYRRSKVDPSSFAYSLLGDDVRPRAAHMVFVGNPGTGKTSIGRLLAKAYHELGILRKPKFLEVERMDLVGKDRQQTVAKTREVLEEAKGGILFVDEAFTLGIVKKRYKGKDTSMDAMTELIVSMDGSQAETNNDDEQAVVADGPLIILAGFPMEMQQFLASHMELRRRFPLTFEFPDYTCLELAKIFEDLAHVKGFDLDDELTIEIIADLLENETTSVWRCERNGRVSEMLLAGARTEVRKRMRAANFEGEEDVDPHLIVLEDVENVVRLEFK